MEAGPLESHSDTASAYPGAPTITFHRSCAPHTGSSRTLLVSGSQSVLPKPSCGLRHCTENRYSAVGQAPFGMPT